MAVDFDAFSEPGELTLPPMLTCDICKREFLLLAHLKRHIESHLDHDISQRTCDECQTVCPSETQLKIHILKVHHNIQNRCTLCRRLFQSEEALSEHRCAQRNIFHCTDCGKKFRRKHLFEKHRLTHSRTSLRCRFCSAVFMKPETLDSHVGKLSCSKSARYYWLDTYNRNKCRLCSEEVETEKDLQDHFAVWHPGQPYLCFWCDKEFFTFDELKTHVHSHVIERFTCSECKIAYTSQEGYRKHKLKHSKCVFKCRYCGRDYLSMSRGKLHEKSCTGVKAIDPTKISRQLNWESRIISKKVRSVEADPVENEPPVNGFDDDESLEDRQGWFDAYYKTEDDFATVPAPVENVVENNRSTDSSESEPDVDREFEFEDKICRMCGDEFVFEYELLHHFIKIHPAEIPHQCPYCPEQCSLFAHLKEHMKTHGIGLDAFHCSNCSRAYRSEALRQKHVDRCMGQVQVPTGKTCRCGRVFQTRCGYKRHKRFKCKKKKTPVISHAVEDVEEEEEEDEVPDEPKSPEVPEEPELVNKKPSDDKYPCRLCPMTFPYERGLVMHFKAQHPGIKPLICPHCGIPLADKLKEHLKTHGIGEEFICELCGRRFNQKFLSKIHELWHEGIEYKCSNCKQKFLSEEKMQRHVAAAKCSNRMSLLKLPCDVCGKHYRSKFGLQTHYLTHTPKESRPVKQKMNCEFCGKWFANHHGLERHRRIHTGEKPYCCRYCPKAFAQEGNCKAHERIHTGEAKPRRKANPPEELIESR